MNPELFKPENREKLDGERLSRNTTWMPGDNLELDFVTAKDGIIEPPDRVDLLFEAGLWVFQKPFVYVGIYNSKPDEGPVEVQVKMREFTQASVLPPEWKAKYEIYEQVHKDTDAHETSNAERSEKELHNQTAFIYGEIVFMYFVPLLEYAKPQPGEVFWDLGCGAGKPLVTASLAFPQLKVCRGIELL